MLFTSQAPIMFLSYAVLSFLAGLCSVVISPLARDPDWNYHAKVRVSNHPTIGATDQYTDCCYFLGRGPVHYVKLYLEFTDDTSLQTGVVFDCSRQAR